MINDEIRIFSLGETALTVEFGTTISENLNRQSIALAEYFLAHPFPGFVESVPAYASTTVFYDPVIVRRSFDGFETAFDAVSSLVADSIESLDLENDTSARTIEIPVRFDLNDEFDLAFVAATRSMTADRLIEIFTSTTYRVFLLGFLPGFSYMGEVDERIATPRKATPRTHVPAGSVGIAGRQTGIYSLASPGGWQVIGQTEVEMFTPYAGSPCYLTAGDRVRFVAI